MVEREKETVNGQLNEDELVQYACDLFDGEKISYWQMKSPPRESEILKGFEGNNYFSDQRAESHKRKKYWSERAKQLLKDPMSKRNDLETAKIGTRHEPELNAQLRARMKVTKK